MKYAQKQTIQNDNAPSVNLWPVSNFQPGNNFTAVILRHTKDNHYEILLSHSVKEHSVIVAHYEDDCDVIADWRFIGAKLNLPLYSFQRDGQLFRFNTYDADPCRLRRFGSALSHRRTRFARNRKMG